MVETISLFKRWENKICIYFEVTVIQGTSFVEGQQRKAVSLRVMGSFHWVSLAENEQSCFI